MKKLILVIMAVCLVTGFALAAEIPVPTSDTSSTAGVVPATITVKGDIIDNQSASAQKPEDLAAFVKTYTKEYALQPQCQTSGYSIFSDGGLRKFDAASNTKVAEFLNKPDSKLQVVVVAQEGPDGLNLVSIDNQP